MNGTQMFHEREDNLLRADNHAFVTKTLPVREHIGFIQKWIPDQRGPEGACGGELTHTDDWHGFHYGRPRNR